MPRKDHHTTEIEECQECRAHRHDALEQQDIAIHGGDVPATGRMRHRLAIPVHRLLLVTQDESGFAERGIEPVVTLPYNRCQGRFSAGSAVLGELPGLPLLPNQEVHGGGIDARKRVARELIGCLIIAGRCFGEVEVSLEGSLVSRRPH